MKTTVELSHRPMTELRAIDVMHPGMISCPPETPLGTVARMMASYRVHAIVVHAHDDDRLPGGDGWGVVTDADLVRTALDEDLADLDAGQVAATPVLTVTTPRPAAAGDAADDRARGFPRDRDRAALRPSGRRAVDPGRREGARRPRLTLGVSG
jgi:CBS domain-containing protein